MHLKAKENATDTILLLLHHIFHITCMYVMSFVGKTNNVYRRLFNVQCTQRNTLQ